MIEHVIEHDYALDLAADKIDFGLDAREEKLLEDHLAECREDCKRYADMMAQDEGLLETFQWVDDDTGGVPDEFSPDYEDEDDEDSDEDVDDGAPKRSRDRADADDDDDAFEGDSGTPEWAPGDASDASDADDESDDDDLEEDDLDPSTPGTPGGLLEASEDVAPAWDPDSDEPEPEPERDDVDDALDRAPDGESFPGGGDLDGESDDAPTGGLQDHDLRDYEAEAEADAATDDELAALEEDNDDTFASEASDAVDRAARENGVHDPAALHKRAEKVVRDTDGLEHTRFGKVAVYRSAKGIAKRNQYALPPTVSASAASQIRNAILRSRTGNTGVERYQKRGRLDGKSLHRIAMHDDRLFKRNTFPDPGKFLVWVMVDVSGSMSGRPVAEAATVARALADASTGAPNVRLEVWAWSTPFKYDSRTQGCSAGVLRVWGRGMPTTEVFRLTELPMGGTPDAPVLEWAWREISKQAKSGETPVVVMCSDGFGDWNFPVAIERAVKHGVKVKSVALGDYVHEDDQLERFGRGNYVPWQGSIEATARPLATMVAEMAAGR